MAPAPDDAAALRDALRLIAITDGTVDGVDGLVVRAAAAVRGGATMVQVRLKQRDPREIVEATRRLVATVGVPVVVNDRVDIALAAGAAGVHLGADDLPVAAARALAGPGFIIGASVGSDEEVLLAEGADYVGIGPAFASASKLDAGDALGPAGVERLAARCAPVPAVAVGGIDADGARILARDGRGIAGIAVIRALLGAADPEAAARALRDAFGA